MKKRKASKGLFLTFAICAAAVAVGCNNLDRDNAVLVLSIRQENTIATKAGNVPVPDTNQFVLQITNSSGEYVYNGAYGARPDKISVPAGAYDLSLTSELFGSPVWERPVYGDRVSVVAVSGENIKVNFLCKMINSGLRVKMTDRYVSKYPGSLIVTQENGSLVYTSSESRFGYFEAGNATFSAVANDGTSQQLFSKQFTAGQMLTLTLDAGSSDTGQSFSVKVDTTATYLSQTILVDEYYESAGDGLSAGTAFSVAEAAQHPEESVWVWGYIVGGDLSSSAINFEAPFTKNSNLAIAATPACKTREQCIAVELASGSDIRETVNLVDHPEKLGCKIYIKGTVKESYFGLVGLKSVKEFQLE
ncbi:MAG: DUF4493 domain-containing protein [Bacteroidales bacterium]|nr:DUF4493 domain-containing protein [Bacteroidales bacterium]